MVPRVPENFPYFHLFAPVNGQLFWGQYTKLGYACWGPGRFDEAILPVARPIVPIKLYIWLQSNYLEDQFAGTVTSGLNCEANSRCLSNTLARG